MKNYGIIMDKISEKFSKEWITPAIYTIFEVAAQEHREGGLSSTDYGDILRAGYDTIDRARNKTA
jgi:hypothetical protein